MSFSIQNYWSQQSSSFGRKDTREYYKNKADEHVQIIQIKDREIGAVDLGCGAGELLEFLMTDIKIDVALDFSDSMLSAARERLGKNAIDFINMDVFSYLGETKTPVWLTAGALNQYFNPFELEKLINIFKSNSNAQSLYLFDCIDPIRYRALVLGTSFQGETFELSSVKLYRRAWRYFLKMRFVLDILLNRYSKDHHYLGSHAMGYAYLPRFWFKLCNDPDLQVAIVNSRYFEYRYHVSITKS